MPTTSDYERMSRGAGLCVTRPRLAVLSVVHHRPHADTDCIIGAVRGSAAGDHQAVHDVLHALSVARHEARVRHDPHHVVCRSCGAIADVEGALGDTACLTAPTSRATTSARPRPSTGVDARRARRHRRPAAGGNQPFRGNGETGKRDRT